MTAYLNLINGEWVPSRSGETRPDINPAHPTEVVASFPSSTAEDAHDAVAAAAAAYPAWKATPMPQRGDLLLKAAALLEAKADEVARDLTREEGKTFGEAKGETLRAVAIFRYFAGEARQPEGEVYPSQTRGTFLYTTREPLGVVGLITPWNFPIAIPAWKIAPALVYGNTVVLKPADLTPLTAWHVADCLHRAGIPKGVFNVIFGRGSVIGNVLVAHPAVRALSFTGSNTVGQQVLQGCSVRGAKVQLEMGGKNPLVVLADANLEHAVELCAMGAFRSTGQKCTATSRVIVERSVLQAFTERLIVRAKQIQVGDPLDSATWMGPAVSKQQLDTVLSYIEAGKAEGATLLAGGNALTAPEYDGGYYVEPTLFTDVSPAMRIVREEIFGPVVAIIPAENFNDAVRLANDTIFGLSASVVTRDLGLAMRFAREIEAGIVHINSETAGAEPQVPFGGYKQSSSQSREQGKAARDFFTQIKTVYVDPPA
jgi:alpha-ketoglutaric semialdehyde dehydrogenase